MVIYTQKEALSSALGTLKNTGDSKVDFQVGLVPTMGALHEGHLSLIKRALAENDAVVVSIFVNPTQFNNPEDLKNYPRTPESDFQLLKTLEKEVLVYIPTISDIYSDGLISKCFEFDNLENQMEGKHRKGHFDGVGTIVSKLFNIVSPQRAYFGEKDFQQLQIIRKLVEKENFEIEVVGCPIVREPNGLAMSSRNKRLNAAQQKEAAFIHHVLEEVKGQFDSQSLEELNHHVAERFLHHPLLKLEYFEIAEERTLKTANSKEAGTAYRAFIAAFIGGVRLIDNMALN